jgi:GNAT superfamily N-acetyltransferase
MIRRATPDDAYQIARLRQAMWDEMNPEWPSDAAFREATFVYWYEQLAAEHAAGWVAEIIGSAVGMALVLLHQHPPRPYGPIRRGYVTSVYVAPQHRRQGHGRALMEAIIVWGRAHQLQRLELRSSDDGHALYETVGFESQELMMLYL